MLNGGNGVKDSLNDVSHEGDGRDKNCPIRTTTIYLSSEESDRLLHKKLHLS